MRAAFDGCPYFLSAKILLRLHCRRYRRLHRHGIVIPDVYNGKPVIGIDNEAFNGCKEITSVFMPDSIVIIGEGAFANCGITNITIPANLFYFGNLAFAYCSKLTTVTLADGASENGKILKSRRAGSWALILISRCTAQTAI